MIEWFHAEGGRQNGPYSSQALAALYHGRQIRLATLVWREGMPGWQPLHTVADLVDLAPAPGPAAPPLPTPPPMPPSATADTRAAQAVVQPAPPARKRLSRGAKVTLILAGLALTLAGLGGYVWTSKQHYQNFTKLIKAGKAVDGLQPLQQRIARFVDENDRCPTDADEGFTGPDPAPPEGLSTVNWGSFENGNCGIEATLDIGIPAVEGDRIWLEYDADSAQWTCTGESPDAMLPLQCRG